MRAGKVIVVLPDQRDVEISRYGYGNSKVGFGVFTFSRRAGGEFTCPGATAECEDICYAKRITEGPVRDVYARNAGDDVPPIPKDAKVLRIHISGDFTTPTYIGNWILRLMERPDVTAWAYTRSWRLPHLLEQLELLRALPNMQLFASMDPSKPDEWPPAGWRRAWVWRDQPSRWPMETRLSPLKKTMEGVPVQNMLVVRDGKFNVDASAYVCPEETGRKPDCLRCGYCFEGQKHDVVFLEHHGPTEESK